MVAGVVLTAAHVVFDDRALTYLPASGVKWFFQRHAGVYEPAPQTPRGWVVLGGYAAQRTADATPGVTAGAPRGVTMKRAPAGSCTGSSNATRSR